MKTCFKCKRDLPPEAFYAHKGMADGLLGKCRECTCRDTRENRAKRADKYREYDRVRLRTPERAAAHREKSRRWRERNPDGPAAYVALNRAVARGELIRPDKCQTCGVACKPDGHHDDHKRHLDVMWLCRPCHAKRHVEIGRVRTLARAYGDNPDWEKP
jgi:hypothetical protein